jgi:hypothetical protein
VILDWLLFLMMATPQGVTGAKECVFFELTYSMKYQGTHMCCEDDEDGCTGHGVAQGVGPVINKGCMYSTG